MDPSLCESARYSSGRRGEANCGLRKKGAIMGVADTITEKLKAAFNPEALEVIDESGNHSVPEGAESHFKVIAVSADFDA